MSKNQDQLQKFGLRLLLPHLGSVTRVTVLSAFKHITFKPQTNSSPLIPSLFPFLPVKGRILILDVRLAAFPPLYPSPHFPVLLKGSRNLGSPPALTPGAPKALPCPWRGIQMFSQPLQLAHCIYPYQVFALPFSLPVSRVQHDADQGKSAKAREWPPHHSHGVRKNNLIWKQRLWMPILGYVFNSGIWENRNWKDWCYMDLREGEVLQSCF